MPEIDPIGNPEYTYAQVAEALATRIQAGRYQRKLPSERDLAREFGVSYQTQRHAMEVLRARGLIITRQGRGTFTTASARQNTLEVPSSWTKTSSADC
jgi:DNA-binding GntR family transcriptional regulator